VQPKLELLRSSLPYRALESLRAPLYFKNPPVADHTPVFATGGIGDTIISLEVCEELNKRVGDVVVYTKYVDAAKVFTDLPVKHEREVTRKGFDFLINMNCISNFQFSNTFKGFRNKALEKIFLDNFCFINQGWEDYVAKHPWLDCLMADKAVKEGLNRKTLAFKFLGLQPRPIPYRIIEDEVPVPKSPFITIHDGFDETHTFKGRSMKNWDLQHWADFIKEVKRNTGFLVVQLGGPSSRIIKSADLNFAGVLSFKQSMKMLSKSKLHVDGDSGLVHAAHRLGVRSVVLFGPTNADFFGYEENINMKPNYCGGCWWLKPSWMKECAMGHMVPECMDSHDPVPVAWKVEQACFPTHIRRSVSDFEIEGAPI
jgi:Glycosyltransferase family 9 (heptosyltransferase)